MNKENITELSSKNMKMDLLRFKDDILKDMRTIEIGLNKKYFKIEESITEKINKFELKIGSLEEKIFELSNLITTDNLIIENIQSLNKFKEEISDSIFKSRAKYNGFEKMTNDEITRINNILNDSIIYPGIIGPSTKFKTFHDFIDYLLIEMNQLILMKDKNGLDHAPFKKKIEQSIEAFKIQINNLTSKQYLFNAINESEQKIKNLIDMYDERLKCIKTENLNNSKKFDEMNKQIEKLFKFKQLLQEKEKEINLHNNEIIVIKKDLNNINEILKELLSYNPIFKKEMERKSSKIYSGVKQYINGQLNAKELTSMKKFTFEKSQSNENFEQIQKSIKTSPFQSSPSKNKLMNSLEIKKKMSYINEYTNLLNRYDDNIDINDNFFISQRIDKSDLLNKNDKKDLNNKKEKEITIKGNDLEDNINLEIKKYNIKKINDFKEKENKIKELFQNKINNIEEINDNYKNINRDMDKCIIKEEDENVLSDNSKKNLNLSYIYKNYENNIQMNNELLKEKLNYFNNSFEANNINLINNDSRKTSRVLNISKDNNFYKIFNPYKVESKKNEKSIFLETDKLYNNRCNTSNNEQSKNLYKKITNLNDEKRIKININNQKINEKKNQTYTCFPKLNKELSLHKINMIEDSTFQNNYISFRNIKNIGDSTRSEVKVAGYIKKPKKILLTSPDNIPPNGFIRKNKRRKSIGLFKKIYEESMKNKSKNHVRSFSSIYQLISSNEESFKKKKGLKNKKE